MASLSFECPDCSNKVKVSHKDVAVRLCANTNTGSYHFICPMCQRRAVKPASQAVVDRLIAYGCDLTVWRLPDELFEPRGGSPFTPDDELDFHLLMDSNENAWFSRLTEMVRQDQRDRLNRGHD